MRSRGTPSASRVAGGRSGFQLPAYRNQPRFETTFACLPPRDARRSRADYAHLGFTLGASSTGLCASNSRATLHERPRGCSTAADRSSPAVPASSLVGNARHRQGTLFSSPSRDGAALANIIVET